MPFLHLKRCHYSLMDIVLFLPSLFQKFYLLSSRLHTMKCIIFRVQFNEFWQTYISLNVFPLPQRVLFCLFIGNNHPPPPRNPVSNKYWFEIYSHIFFFFWNVRVYTLVSGFFCSALMLKFMFLPFYCWLVFSPSPHFKRTSLHNCDFLIKKLKPQGNLVLKVLVASYVCIFS